jgi:hypothetical protein
MNKRTRNVPPPPTRRALPFFIEFAKFTAAFALIVVIALLAMSAIAAGGS